MELRWMNPGDDLTPHPQDKSSSESLDHVGGMLVEWVPNTRPCWMSPGAARTAPSPAANMQLV